MATVYDFSAKLSSGEDKQLADYRGKVLLIVNTASKCGFTPQYKGLEELYKQYGQQGLEILGFPCDQFGHQEPGSDEEIQGFCERNFGVTFPLFSKINVNGVNQHPLYKYLKSEASGLIGDSIKWNFTKFLVSRKGKVVGRFAPATSPDEISVDIAKALKAKA
ncbi:MAG TPA: glutathione peroxidase [Candidatus Saccharimonadales bacterium]|nr:glutathione peroxidase [Candidatus Saccharimonadales bacterium]